MGKDHSCPISRSVPSRRERSARHASPSSRMEIPYGACPSARKKWQMFEFLAVHDPLPFLNEGKKDKFRCRHLAIKNGSSLGWKMTASIQADAALRRACQEVSVKLGILGKRGCSGVPLPSAPWHFMQCSSKSWRAA